jgi:hypothetical protein
VALVLLAVYLPLAAWEIGRKVRPPEAETSYETWSSRLGWRAAGLLPALLVAVLAAALGWVALACGRFLAAPSARTAELRPAVELYAVVASGGLVVALAVARGLAWGPR